ncbi:MAG: histidinol-phosphate transaminase [Lentisphaerae bacterium]|jgi:histidinol-phosphate aminotransferase|nr:histidinol-phosphate transaminase [Lentisphaerota bacterium]
MNPLIRPSVQQLTAYTPGEQPKDSGLIKLNTNENPYPPSPAVARALREFQLETLRLYPDPISRSLRERIAALHDVSPEQVFVGNGSDEVLRLAIRAFTRSGGAIAAFDPTYSLYPVLAAAEDVGYRSVPLPDDFGWADPPADLDASLFCLANPNAPTGVLYPLDTVEDFCARFPGVVLLDEAYVDFAADYDAVPLARERPNVILCRTLSKSFSLAGLRVGYAIGPVDLIGALDKLKDSYNMNALAQALALAALGDIDWMRANARRIVATRERVAAELTRRAYRVVPSAANFLFIQPPDDLTAADLFARLRQRHILVRYFPAPRTQNHLRVSIGTDSDMDAFLAAIQHQ